MLSVLPLSCALETEKSDSIDSTSQAITPGHCKQAVAKDILIAGLVKDSWIAGYPLTRLTVDAAGNVGGPALPPLLAGDLEVINSIPAAAQSVARAVRAASGLSDYGVNGIGPDTDACDAVPAWTPSGTTIVATTANEVFTNGVNQASWLSVQKAFGKECPLIKRTGNRDLIDPPGDGSTNLPASSTVSATGVTANAFGICAAGTPALTYCKLSYSTGVRYTGRKCQVYYGSLRCLLY
jgi:hypothetical protein